MSRRLPPSQRPGRNKGESDGTRWVKIGILDGKPQAYLGVMIGKGAETNENGTIVAPDEARCMAASEEDLALAAKMKKVAADVDNYLAHAAPGSAMSRAKVIAPKIAGPEALGWWLDRYAHEFRSCWRSAMRAGWPPDAVMWVAPKTESLDEIPEAVAMVRLGVARAKVDRNIPTGTGNLDGPPRPGYFRVVASRGDGRFRGTFFGMLPIPGDDEDLPESLALLPPPHEAN